VTAIRAEITGSTQATACGVTVSSRNAPVTALCRALIEAGLDPAAPLEAYRGETLCLFVISIGAGAQLTVKESTRDGRPRFVKLSGDLDALRADGSVHGRPPLRQTAQGVGGAPLDTGKPLADGDPHIAATTTSVEAAL
jgi:hypothetical protein